MSEYRMLIALEQIEKHLKEMNKKATAYMEAKLSLEMSETKEEKRVAIRYAMQKII